MTEGEPILLTSLASAAILSSAGEFNVVREARGAPINWGGVYGQLVRLTGPWQVHVALGDEWLVLGPTRVPPQVTPHRATFQHRVGPLEVTQEVGAVAEPPGVLRTMTFRSTFDRPLKFSVVTAFEPFLLPVLVEGVRPLEFRAETHEVGLAVRQRGFGLLLEASLAPSRLYLDHASWRGGRREGPIRELAAAYDLEVRPHEEAQLRLLLHGGLERDLDRSQPAAARALDDPGARLAEAERSDAAWLRATPELQLPDAPELEQAYRSARGALRRLYTEPGDDLTGLVAGYPWYSAIWCRDLAWMLPAVIWLGDLDWAGRSLETVRRFQARRDLAVLGGEAGELPMQVSPGPVFLYGTSDTSLYFPGLVDRFRRHGGDSAVVERWKAAIDGVIAWGRRRTDAATGLLRNGGEVEEMSAAADAVARVRYGIDAPDTTIWDSADRRDHAVDIQVLWRDALRAASRLGAGDPELMPLVRRLEDGFVRTFRWAAEGYLYDSIRNGRGLEKLRPNALRAVSAGLVDAELARSIVARAQRSDLATEWGLRTLASGDPSYDPTAYHEGQVWTIATAWAADAAYAVGDRTLGYRWLRTIADRYAAEGGLANECYRGDSAVPYDSCFLLGFSLAPFLTLLFERLWGLDVDATGPSLRVEPAFPEGWGSAAVLGLRVGTGRADLRFASGALTVAWRGDRPLRVTGRGVTIAVPDGGEGTLPVAPEPSAGVLPAENS